MIQHEFRLQADWQGGRLGTGQITAENLVTTVSVPKELGGPAQGTNPEEMLMGAAATCYLITLASILENRKLPVASLTLQTIGTVEEQGGGLVFTTIRHLPKIVLYSEAGESSLQIAEMAAERAEKACMISKAIRANVSIRVESEISLVSKI